MLTRFLFFSDHSIGLATAARQAKATERQPADNIQDTEDAGTTNANNDISENKRDFYIRFVFKIVFNFTAACQYGLVYSL